MALDLAKDGIRVNCACPGWVETPLVKDWFGQQAQPAAAREYIFGRHPLGKAHGFDLVLPLQTGHRWVLIGDQNQLSPYRFNDFKKALASLDDVVESLFRLPTRAGGLVDMELVHKWRLLSDEEKAGCSDRWISWLPVFARLHRACDEASPTSAGHGESDRGGAGHDALAATSNAPHNSGTYFGGILCNQQI